MRQKASRILGSLAAAGLALSLGGCIQIDETLHLNRDLSGTSSINLSMDFGAVAPFVAGIKRSLSGETGPPTPAEIEAARKEMLEQGAKDEAASKAEDAAALKQQFAAGLPPGVKLLSGGTVEKSALKVGTRIELGFDDVRKLAQLKMPSDKPTGSAGGAGSGPGADVPNPYESPFSGLKVVDEGKTVLITLAGADPATRLKSQKEIGQLSPDALQMMSGVLGDAHFAFTLDTPLEVVETNATRRDGHTLYWLYKFTDMSAAPPTLMVRLKK
jgi:hypothetical protein